MFTSLHIPALGSPVDLPRSYGSRSQDLCCRPHCGGTKAAPLSLAMEPLAEMVSDAVHASDLPRVFHPGYMEEGAVWERMGRRECQGAGRGLDGVDLVSKGAC